MRMSKDKIFDTLTYDSKLNKNSYLPLLNKKIINNKINRKTPTKSMVISFSNNSQELFLLD